MDPDEFILLHHRRAMFGPRPLAIRNDLSLLDKLHGEHGRNLI
jgi:hypothetical protein